MEEILKELQKLIGQVVNFSPRAVVSVLVFLSFWFMSIIIKRIIRRIGKMLVPSKKAVFNLMGQLIKGVLLIWGAVMALSKMGVNINALVAGLGLTGFALGFALRDVLSNVLAGVLIMIYRPFERNDRIIVTNFEGLVTDIDLRYTTLQGENKKILIPNATLFTNAISVLKVGE
jgi:small conductance mechanosensitive channel